MVNIKLKNVSKSFRNFQAINDISLEVKDKEYFIILGPTGAGKTTLLKLISGLHKPDKGKVFFNDKDVTEKPPEERDLGFMFENYALFPHMSIFENIAYSSRVHDRDPEQRKSLVEQVLMMTLLSGRESSLPKEMSGGMKQRVALCRALLNLEETRLLILDEPLKALDAGLRNSLRKELLDMAKSELLNLTVIHVTNDEREAMMVADRIAIINKGKLIQVGTPYEIYYHPKSLFVAYFMSEINHFEGIAKKDNQSLNQIKNNSKPLDAFFSKIHKDSDEIGIDLRSKSLFSSYIKRDKFQKINHEEKILLIVRANHMKIRLGDRTEDKDNAFKGKIARRKFMGVFYRFEVIVKINNQNKIIVVTEPATYEIHRKFIEGLEVTIYFPRELGIVFEHPGKDILDEVLKLN